MRLGATRRDDRHIEFMAGEVLGREGPVVVCGRQVLEHSLQLGTLARVDEGAKKVEVEARAHFGRQRPKCTEKDVDALQLGEVPPVG